MSNTRLRATYIANELYKCGESALKDELKLQLFSPYREDEIIEAYPA